MKKKKVTKKKTKEKINHRKLIILVVLVFLVGLCLFVLKNRYQNNYMNNLKK